MSINEFFDGQMSANLANRRVVSEWQEYSERLKQQLQKTEFDFAKAESGRIGFAHLFRTVLEELRRLDPKNSLLEKDVQLKILGDKVAEKAAEMGYSYDPSTGTLIDKRQG